MLFNPTSKKAIIANIVVTITELDVINCAPLTPYVSENIVTIIGICLLIGAMAKSSQVGLHVWLPMAMEGPTPVSALIHAATMVTAGVYLLMRTSPLIEYSSTVLILCLWIGAITTIFSSLIGLFQQDIKKVIAYSTMSQLAREYLLFRHQTICVEFIVKFILMISNSQITKARDYIYNHNSNSFINSLKHIWVLEKWKTLIISKLVGISEAIRLILVKILFKIIFIKFTLKNTDNKEYKYETHNTSLSNKDSLKKDNLFKFNQWLAGLIDGDGYFILTKKGYASFEVTMDARDKAALYEIKHKYGGSIKPVANAKALRYKLRHKKGLIDLINGVNGLIRNPARLLQMNKLCVKYGIELKESLPLTFNNGWFAGFLDSDGSIYLNEKSVQVCIAVSQKNKFLLEPLINLYGGKIYILSPKIEAFKYVIYRKKELFDLIDNYLSKHPLKTNKSSRLKLIKNFYQVRLDRKSDVIINHNEWISFKDKWDK